MTKITQVAVKQTSFDAAFYSALISFTFVSYLFSGIGWFSVFVVIALAFSVFSTFKYTKQYLVVNKDRGGKDHILLYDDEPKTSESQG